MKRLYVTLVATVVLCGTALLAPALRADSTPDNDGVIVVLNKRNPTSQLTKAQVQNLFLGKTAFWHGVVPVKVFVRPSGSQVARQFFETILGKSSQSFAKHWDKLQLSGRAVAPTVVGDMQSLMKEVMANPGAIGFASAAEAWEAQNVKVVEIR